MFNPHHHQQQQQQQQFHQHLRQLQQLFQQQPPPPPPPPHPLHNLHRRTIYRTTIKEADPWLSLARHPPLPAWSTCAPLPKPPSSPPTPCCRGRCSCSRCKVA
ncbi:hypothetical protein ANANG_G00264240 [Anguilla anguilla]|uniref:Uncharacterized protein n=1 Tax=Anguilla anguilla TaxID=7936 RepID=A0A9D3RL79_ANGAN|nr:hypothetical protein ANANG_G00264240 [Anguilla anguilla]